MDEVFTRVEQVVKVFIVKDCHKVLLDPNTFSLDKIQSVDVKES